jgi:hypothetical protein
MRQGKSRETQQASFLYSVSPSARRQKKPAQKSGHFLNNVKP